MAEYIEREAVLKTAKDGNHSDFGRSIADLTSLREVLEDIPSADVVEVVRCKECKHCEHILDDFCKHWYQCKRLGNSFQRKPDDYCSYGERKGRR